MIKYKGGGMADDGWIKLHRKLMENPIFLNPNLLQIFIYCLLKANHKDNEMIWNDELMTVKTGSFITGRLQMAKDLKQKDSALYKRLQLLTKLGYIELKSNNKFTLLTIVKYKSYQVSEMKEEQQSNNKVTTKEQQSNTNNNDKNEKNDKNNITTAIAVPAKDDLIDSLIKDFSSQYEEVNRIAYKVFIGKDRKAMGGILAYYKKQKPQADSLTARQDLSKVFRAVITTDFKNEYLNGVSISKLNTSFNDYYLALKSKQSADVTVNDLS